MRVLYRADGGSEIGTGHVLRGLRIAQAMHAPGEVELTFLTRSDPWALQRIAEDGWQIEGLTGDEGRALCEAARWLAPDLIALDRLETTAALTGSLRELGAPLVTFDDVGEGRLLCRAVINTLEEEPQPERLAASDAVLYQGPAYAVLPREYESAPRPRAINPQVGSILVTMGGGDPLGLALKAARALMSTDMPRVAVVAGAASPWLGELTALAQEAGGRITVTQSVPGLLDEFLRADLAIVAGGLTMHEAMAAGTPAIAVCQEVRHQAEMAARFRAQGAMVSLGKGEALAEAEIAEAVAALAADPEGRRAMSRRGQELVDGQGTRRVAEIFTALARRA